MSVSEQVINPALRRGEVIVGYIQGVTPSKSADQAAEVSFHLNGVMHTHKAMSTIPIQPDMLGRNVVLAFVEGDLSRPIVMGLLWRPDEGRAGDVIADKTGKTDKALSEPTGDPGSMAAFEVIQAKDRVEIKCGKASITLTQTGKILLRGEYISTHAKGTHRIKGGSVQIN